MRTYNPPVFNLTCRIWLRALPASLFSWDGSPPVRDPDITSECQLYIPRDNNRTWNHAQTGDPWGTHLNAGFEELRLPKGTPLTTVWGVNFSTDFSQTALVECPAGSGELYLAVWANDRHKGFPNEYRVGLLAQVARALGTSAGGIGLAGSAEVSGPAHLASAGVGIGGGAVILLPFGAALPPGPWGPPTYYLPAQWVTTAGIGLAATASGSQTPGTSPVGIGLAGTSTNSSGVQTPAVGIGLAAINTNVLAQVAPSGTVGLAATATVVNTPVASVGGPTCATATGVAMPSNNRVNLTAGAVKWVKCTIPAGTYKVSMTKNSGADVTCICKFGTCPSPASWGALQFPSLTCTDSVLAAGTIYVECTGHATLTGDIQLIFAPGTCQ